MKLNWLSKSVEEMVKACENDLEIKHYRAIEKAMDVDWNVDKMDNDTLIYLNEFVDIYLGE